MSPEPLISRHRADILQKRNNRDGFRHAVDYVKIYSTLISLQQKVGWAKSLQLLIIIAP